MSRLAEHEAPVTRVPRPAHIAQNCKEPRLDLRATKSVEVAEGAQIAFLHRVFGVGAWQQVPRKRIDIVKMGQSERPKAARLVALVLRLIICGDLAPGSRNGEANSQLSPR